MLRWGTIGLLELELEVPGLQRLAKLTLLHELQGEVARTNVKLKLGPEGALTLYIAIPMS